MTRIFSAEIYASALLLLNIGLTLFFFILGKIFQKVPALSVIDAIRNLHQQEVNTAAVAGTSVRTSAFTNFDSRIAQKETATSINPRLRPKPYSSAVRLNLADSSSRLLDVNRIRNFFLIPLHHCFNSVVAFLPSH